MRSAEIMPLLGCADLSSVGGYGLGIPANECAFVHLFTSKDAARRRIFGSFDSIDSNLISPFSSCLISGHVLPEFFSTESACDAVRAVGWTCSSGPAFMRTEFSLRSELDTLMRKTEHIRRSRLHS